MYVYLPFLSFPLSLPSPSLLPFLLSLPPLSLPPLSLSLSLSLSLPPRSLLPSLSPSSLPSSLPSFPPLLPCRPSLSDQGGSRLLQRAILGISGRKGGRLRVKKSTPVTLSSQKRAATVAVKHSTSKDGKELHVCIGWGGGREGGSGSVLTRNYKPSGTKV